MDTLRLCIDQNDCSVEFKNSLQKAYLGRATWLENEMRLEKMAKTPDYRARIELDAWFFEEKGIEEAGSMRSF